MLFCYRWLLLEMKREFAFDDSLRMLEVLWSSLPADPPHKELKLYDVEFQPVPVSTPPVSPLVKTIRENPYTKVCALRRQSSSISLHNYSGRKSASVKRQIHSLDENVGRIGSILDIKLKHQSLDDAAIAQKTSKSLDNSPKSPKFSPKQSDLSLLELRPRSVSPLETKSDSHILNNSYRLTARSKSVGLSASMTNLMKISRKPGHFRDMKEKLTTNRVGMFSSLEILDKTNSMKQKNVVKSNSKMIKNLNEFLNFVPANKNKICDRSASVSDMNEKPKITLTKSSFDDTDRTHHNSPTSNICDDCSSPDDSQEYFPMTASITNELRLELENLDRQVFGRKYEYANCKNYADLELKQKIHCKSDDVFVWENPLHQNSNAVCNSQSKIGIDSSKVEKEEMVDSKEESPQQSAEIGLGVLTNSCEEITECKRPTLLPPPNEFGGGNPFLMFLCITVLLQHRDHIMSKGMDYNEMAMHFDKMIRKHNVTRVLNQARQMYARYIKQHTRAQQQLNTCTGDC